MEAENNEILIICSPENYGKIVGNFVHCTKCNTSVYLSDSSINAVKAKYPEENFDSLNVKVVCIDCFIKHSKSDENSEILPLTNEQIKELKDNIF